MRAFLNALGTAVYTGLIAWFFSSAQFLFGNKPDNFLAPMLMLTLLIISASVTGYLVLEKPISLYLAGDKKEGIMMLFKTIGFLALFGVIIAFFIAR